MLDSATVERGSSLKSLLVARPADNAAMLIIKAELGNLKQTRWRLFAAELAISNVRADAVLTTVSTQDKELFDFPNVQYLFGLHDVRQWET